MEEAFELANYLPLSFKTQSEQEYIAFLWEAFETNYTNEKRQFAFLAFHMLTMSFVYFNIWQIKRNRPADFEKATYGFSKDHEDIVLKAISPFTFSRISESAIFRFLKLIDCDNAKIGSYTKLVKDRNDSAHPSGVIHYADQRALDVKITETLRVVAEIQKHSRCVIEECYRKFLLDGNAPEDREYLDDTDQIREALVHENYLSQKDIEFCLAFDISEHEEIESHANASNIASLHQKLKDLYGEKPDA